MSDAFVRGFSKAPRQNRTRLQASPKPNMNVRFRAWFVCLSIALRTSGAFGTDLRDVLAHPEKYEGREVDLIGIARVPGYFYLFADIDAAAKTDLAKGVLIRQNNFAGQGYREADRQWVRVTGRMSSHEYRGWDAGTGVLLKRVQFLRDRTRPRIADRNVLGVFQNATAEPLAVDLLSRSEGRETFFLAAHETDKTFVWEGQLVVSRLDGPNNVSLDLRKIGKPIARREITLRHLPTNYEYSPEWSEKRTLYFRILRDRIESVPAVEARGWKLDGFQGGVK
ncbi:MAG: hypothetical protein ACM3NN_15460 [Nitrospirota bacterium]